MCQGLAFASNGTAGLGATPLVHASHKEFVSLVSSTYLTAQELVSFVLSNPNQVRDGSAIVPPGEHGASNPVLCWMDKLPNIVVAMSDRVKQISIQVTHGLLK